MTYKIGMKVKVKPLNVLKRDYYQLTHDIILEKNFSKIHETKNSYLFNVPLMKKYCGKILIIKSIAREHYPSFEFEVQENIFL